jgi:prepilin-type N-terminal cleavage/methylation domain-containing protein
MDNLISNRRGFTLLELIAVLMILGILVSVAVPRFIDLEAAAVIRAVDAAVSELNGRESLVWSKVKITRTSYDIINGDTQVWALMQNDSTGSHPDLGGGYSWTVGPTKNGGTLSFKGSETFDLSRRVSTIARPAIWSRKP